MGDFGKGVNEVKLSGIDLEGEKFASHELAYLQNLVMPFNKFLHPISSVKTYQKSIPVFSNPAF